MCHDDTLPHPFIIDVFILIFVAWQAAAENLELRGRAKSDLPPMESTSPAASTFHHNPVQAASQVMPPQLKGSDSKPTYAQT